MLSKLSGPNGIIRQTEFFTYSDRDKEAIRACQDLGLKFPQITTWIRAKKEDFKIVKEMGVKETGILTSCSDYHIFYKLGMTRRQAMDHYLSVAGRSGNGSSVNPYHGYSLTAMLALARAALTCAKERRESRGAHFRSDYPDQSMEFDCATLIGYENGSYKVSYDRENAYES